jgi:hypothetical protein
MQSGPLRSKLNESVFFKKKPPYSVNVSRGSAVDIAAGYRLDDRGDGVPVPVGSRIFASAFRPDRL